MTPERRPRLREIARNSVNGDLTTPLTEFEVIKKRADSIGILIFNYNAGLSDDMTDAETDRIFQIAKAMGASTISAVGPKTLFRRLDPLAKQYGIRTSYDTSARGMLEEAEIQDLLRGLSDYSNYNLDAGHYVAGGGDPIAFLNKYHDRVIDVHIKDRKRNNGRNVPLGAGTHRSGKF
jgi:sugar phosphate isomerase/epimerase